MSEELLHNGAWVRPPATRDQIRYDVVLAVVLFALSVLSMTLLRASGGSGVGEAPETWASVVCLGAVILPLSLRRRFPAAVTVVTCGGFIAAVEFGVPEVLVLSIACFLALYTLGAWSRSRRLAQIVRWSVIAAMGLWLVLNFVRVDMFGSAGQAEGGEGLARLALGSAELATMLYAVLTNVLYFAGAIWFGRRAWTAARDQALIRRQAERLHEEQRRVAAQAVVLERLRIARELHDAVAHHVSVMGVQAAAARLTLRSDAESAEQAIRHVEDSARSTVAELYQLLGALRDEGAGAEQTGGSSAELGVETIPQLIEDARRAGMSVAWHVVGEPCDLPPLVQLNLYRIVQEALTNVRKHAGEQAHADVRLRYGAQAVEAEIADDGARRRATLAVAEADTRHRHGLNGMRERARSSGGTLQAGPREKHGFLVLASFPYSLERI